MTEFVNMPIPVEKFAAVCALLGGTALSASINPVMPEIQPMNERHASDIAFASGHKWEPETASGEGVPDASDEVDAHGHPWSAELHASTKGTTKDGLWRMKVGVTRPDPMPGFPKTDETPSSTSTTSQASTVADGATAQVGTSQTAEPASAAASQEEDDEFAAFRTASAKIDATEATAAASIPARVWTDADLGALCNQAAMKLGDPVPVKEVIAAFVPAGEVAHSRNVPTDKRADFAAAIEAKAGIEFAG